MKYFNLPVSYYKYCCDIGIFVVGANSTCKSNQSNFQEDKQNTARRSAKH